MSNIRNELLFSGDKSAIMNMLESVINRKSQTLNFNDIFPIPSELVPIPANLARVKIDCYLTAVNPKTADYHWEKLPADEYDRLFNLVTDYFDCNDGYCHRITGEYIPPRAAFFDDGRKMVEFLQRYGAPHWYDWCRQNWGQAENPRISVFSDNRLIFDTDTAPSRKVVEKLAELFPSVEICYRWASRGGRFAGTATYENGHSISEHVFLPFSEEAKQIEMLLFPTVFRAEQSSDCEQPEPI